MTVKKILGTDLPGKILICYGLVIEITSVYDNLLYGKPFLAENSPDLPPDTHTLKLKTLLEYGFSIYTVKEARQIFKEFLKRNT